MSKKVAIDALNQELRSIQEEIEEAQQEAAQIARVISMLTGKDAGEGRVSIRASKISERRPSPESQAGKVLAFIETSGPVTMGEVIRNYYGGTAPASGSKEWNKIGIYPGTLVRKGLAVKMADGRYRGVAAPTSTNGSAPEPAMAEEKVDNQVQVG